MYFSYFTNLVSLTGKVNYDTINLLNKFKESKKLETCVKKFKGTE